MANATSTTPIIDASFHAATAVAATPASLGSNIDSPVFSKVVTTMSAENSPVGSYDTTGPVCRSAISPKVVTPRILMP